MACFKCLEKQMQSILEVKIIIKGFSGIGTCGQDEIIIWIFIICLSI
jgi:hypothetical protein